MHFSRFSTAVVATVVTLALLFQLTMPTSGETRGSTSAIDRVKAIIDALSKGDPANYEVVARENFAPAFFAARTTERRAAFLQQLHGDFGTLKIVKLEQVDSEVFADVVGERGPRALMTFTIEPSAVQMIVGVNVELGGGNRDRGELQIPPPPITASMSARDMTDALNRWLQPILTHDDFAGVLMVAKDGVPFVWKAYGLSDRERNKQADNNTAYNIASIGKKFTQAAIARLIQDGRLKLSTTVGSVIPNYPNADGRLATVEQLVSMQGGISDFFGPDFERAPKSKFASNHAYFEFVSALPQMFKPGSSTEYCNGCYVVLGEMIERTSGIPFEEFVARNVFAPAGMKRSGYFHSTNLPMNTAYGYTRENGPGSNYVNAAKLHGVAGSGAGGVYSTPIDLLSFDNALRNGVLLGPDMTAWVLGGKASGKRNDTEGGFAGGAPGVSALLESGGKWTVIVTSNVDQPLPARLGLEIIKALRQSTR